MADHSENTPFLADNDHGDSHDESGSHFIKVTPANSHFRRTIRILTSLTSFLSLSIFGLLIASYVVLNVAPVQFKWGPDEAIRDLAICLFVNFLLSAPTIFIQIPILINMAVHIAMSIVILVFSAGIFGNGWPNSNMCRRWQQPIRPGPYKPLPETRECTKAKNDIRIMMGVSGGVGIVIGILILATLLLRLVALFRTKFWERRNTNFFKGSGWKPSGFTVQFTLSVLPNKRPAAAVKASGAVDPSSGAEEGRLIET
jgi:hypothetical protein